MSTSEPGGTALVLGLGNPLMTDDGFGLAVLGRLEEEWTVGQGAALVDGGTWGMQLLPAIESADRLLLLDAIDAGRAPGAPIRLTREELPRYFDHKLSPHQIDLREVLALAELRGRLPGEVVAVGAQPAAIELGTSLSDLLSAAVAPAVEAAVHQLRAWGIACAPRVPACTS